MQGTGTNATGDGKTPDWLGESVAESFAEFQRVLEHLAATEGQLVASALLLVALFVGVFVFPAAVASGRAAVRRRVTDDRRARAAGLLSAYAPTTFSALLVRTVQLTLVALAVASILVVWGLLDLAAVTRDLARRDGPGLVNLIVTFLLLAAAFVASDQLKRTVGAFSQRLNRVTQHQEEILLRVGQVTLFVTVTAMILGLWGVELGGLLVGAGFLGIVVGLAARQTLGALIAGFVLMFSRPFTIGDWVEIDDSEGIVTDITMFNTRLENFDGEFVVIPNDRVSDSSLTNRSQKGLLRLRTDVGVDYETDVEHASDVAMEAMDSVEHVVASPAPQVVPKAFGDSAIHLELRYWIDHPTPPRKWRAVSAVVQRVKRAFDEEDVTIPYPQRELSAREGTAVDAAEPGSLGDGSADGGTGNGRTAESVAADPDD